MNIEITNNALTQLKSILEKKATESKVRIFLAGIG